MQVVRTHLRVSTIVAGALFVVLPILYITPIASVALSNFGLIETLRLLTHSPRISDPILPSSPREFFDLAKVLDSKNLSAYRGLGFYYWSQDEDFLATEQWRAISFTFQDYLDLYQHADGNADETVRWLRAAEQEDGKGSELWAEVGLLCQRDPNVDGICLRFLAYNKYNWFVDPIFQFERKAWRFNRKEGVNFDIVSCPEINNKRCAVVGIGDMVPKYGAGWHQCMKILPGVYNFSARIKVEIDADGVWRPLYLQGNVNGEPKGIWPGYESGSVDWTWWEMQTEIPQFDNNWACFNPVRIEGRGQAWMYDANLIIAIK